VTFSKAKVSSLTSDGFFSRRKCPEILAPGWVQEAGGAFVEGSGGSREGNVTGVGFEGGDLCFSVSCCPASRLPMNKMSYISNNTARAAHVSDETCVGYIST
jgi:hypothetical protein